MSACTRRPCGAPRLCDEAIRISATAGDQLSRALAYRTLAEVLGECYPGDDTQAEVAIGEAVRIHEAISNKPELARSYVSYTHLLQRRGEAESAKSYLTQAIEMFCQMGMKWDLAGAEQILQTLS